MEDFSISCRIVYSKPFMDEDVVFTKHPTVEQLSSQISTSYENLFLTGLGADVVFHIGDEKIPAHKVVLSSRVPYFDKMLSSDMVESKTGVIKMQDAEPEPFKQVLRHIYSGKLPDNLETSALNILPFADKFDLTDLREACVYWMERGLKASNAVATLITADLFRCEDVKRKCLLRLNEWKTAMDPTEFECLEPRLLIELIKT